MVYERKRNEKKRHLFHMSSGTSGGGGGGTILVSRFWCGLIWHAHTMEAMRENRLKLPANTKASEPRKRAKETLSISMVYLVVVVVVVFSLRRRQSTANNKLLDRLVVVVAGY